MRGTSRGTRALWLALALALVGRVVLFAWPVYPDEAGFHLVATGLLDGGGDQLYGRYWVDRPPVLIGLFTIGAALGDVLWMRVVAAVGLLAFVVLLWAAVRRLGGHAGWAAFVAAAFVVSPLVGAETANGEAFAIPFVAAGLYAVVRAVDAAGHRAGVLWGLAAGVAGALAVSVKQNFADVFVFALVLLVGLGLRRQRTWATVARVLGAGVAGAALVGGLMVAWALGSGSSLADLWLAVVQFRVDASAVLEEGDRSAIEVRQRTLTWRALGIGALPFAVVIAALAVRTRFRVSALSYAVGVLILFEAVCVVEGGNYWKHYLMGLAPGLVLAAGVWGRWRVVRAAAAYVLVAALVSVPLHAGALSRTDTAQSIGGFVGAAARPGDTATVMYGRADLQWATGMESPYRHLWSLPVRVLDPDLEELGALLASDERPTWLVQAAPPDLWGLGHAGQVHELLVAEYDVVWQGCGALVWLRAGVERQLPTTPPACAR